MAAVECKKTVENIMMPAQAIWMIRLSLVYLIIAVLFGGIIFIQKVINIHPAIWSLLPIHYEVAIWGWLVQFLMGTAYWMFPKYILGTRRGSESLAWAMVILFNCGLILLVISTFAINIAIVARGLIFISICQFVILVWQRVVTYRNVNS